MPGDRGSAVRIGLIDEYELVVAGLVAALAPYDDRVQVVDLATASRRNAQVDLLLHDGFDERRMLDAADLATVCGAKLVAFSWSSDPAQIARALGHGAVGYVLKSLPAAEIVEALERIHAGHVVRPPLPSIEGQHATRLTVRETEIVRLIASGRTNEQIATLLFLSINSIKTHIRSAYRKMEVTRRSQAVTWAFAHGVVPEEAGDGRRV